MHQVPSFVSLLVFALWGSSCLANIHDYEQLLRLEQELQQAVDDYANELEERIAFVNAALLPMQTVLNNSRDDPEAYLSNPLNAFSLIRHMHKDWVNWELFMEQPVGQEYIDKLAGLSTQLPTDWHLREAQRGIELWQQSHKLKAKDIAAGLSDGQQDDVQLSPVDCYALGMFYFDKLKFELAGNWFEAGLQLLAASHSSYAAVYEQLGTTHAKLTQMLARALLNQNRQPEALKAVQRALSVSADASLIRLHADIKMRIRVAPANPI